MSLNYNCWMDQHKDLYEEKTGRRSAARRERKKESTRKRRVACPFHLVYQATYRYNAAPLELSRSPFTSAMEAFQFFSYFKSLRPQKSSSSLSLSLQVLFRFTDSVMPYPNERSNRFGIFFPI